MPAISVAKVGGSLLACEQLPRVLNNWLAAQNGGHWVLVAGGGELVESIRAADRTHKLGEAAAHWLAIDAMQATARLLAKLVPEARLVASWSVLRERASSPGLSVFEAEPFLRQVEPNVPGQKLIEHWDVTSDSIAARVAIALHARELVLLKSAAPRHADWTLAELSDAGYVDRFLPRLEGELPPVRCIGLWE